MSILDKIKKVKWISQVLERPEGAVRQKLYKMYENGLPKIQSRSSKVHHIGKTYEPLIK